MITIQPQYLTLSKLLDGRLFKIPEYQRAYSWKKHQRDDLFKDIEKVHEKGEDAGHFMAALVCLRRKKQTLGTDEFYQLVNREYRKGCDATINVLDFEFIYSDLSQKITQMKRLIDILDDFFTLNTA